MNQIITAILVVCSLFSAGCSQKSETKYFSTYQEVKKFCDEAVRVKDIRNFMDYADLSNISATKSNQFKMGLINFERAISNKALVNSFEFTQDEHREFLNKEYNKQTPEMRNLIGQWPELKWNITPDKILVYVFSLRQPDSESEFQLTVGLSQQKKGWVIVSSY